MTDEEKKSYIDELTKYYESTKDSSNYSMGRIDLLIISVSGGGIYACLEILKFINGKNINSTPFKWIGALFALSIMVNFLSQWFSYYANFNGSRWAEKEKKSLVSNDGKYKTDIDKYSKKSDSYNNLTKFTNKISTFLMLSGLLGIIIFISVTF